MFIPKIDENRCKACGLCESVCPRGVIAVNTERIEVNGLGCAEIINSGCVGCRRCVLMCPDIAISIAEEKGG